MPEKEFEFVRGGAMTAKDFEDFVREAFPYGIEYGECSFKFFTDDNGDPAGIMSVEFGVGNEYELRIILGEDGEPGINTYDYFTVELCPESVYAYCLFEAQGRLEKVRGQ